MAPSTDTERRRRVAAAFALLCVAATATAVALTPFANAKNTRPAQLGHVKGHTPRPLCPQQPSETQNPVHVTRPCFVIGSVTGFQLKADGEHHVMRAPSRGKVVAWAVDLGKPNKVERNAFGSQNLFGTKRYGKIATARLGILKPKKQGKYKLVRQSPTVKLTQAFGELHYITLNRPLTIKKGEIAALTVQTWLPSLALERDAPNSTWRGSRPKKKCSGRQNAIAAKPQTKKGSVRGYGCIFKARLLYWAYYVPGR